MKQINLDTSIQYIKGVGEKRFEDLKRLELEKVSDLLSFYPREYEDRTKMSTIKDIYDGEIIQIVGILYGSIKNANIRKNFSIQKATFLVEGGKLDVVWYNNKYVDRLIKPGKKYILYGKIKGAFGKYELQSPEFEEYTENTEGGKIKPVYHLTKNITQKFLYKIIHEIISISKNVEDAIPKDVKNKYGYLKTSDAIFELHVPTSFDMIKKARNTMAFEEFMYMQMALSYIKGKTKKEKGISFSNISIEDVIQNLPYKLTDAQKRVMEEIENDLESEDVTERLLQGDVGSGKTVIAALAAYKAYMSGYQTVVMVPTAILADQHLESFENILNEMAQKNIKIGLLKSAMRKREKEEIISQISNGDIDILIGTHSILEENVVFKKLGLVITDEQHRFGVRQREKVLSKGENVNTIVMSATPIPRTLGLILYGDLDISVIDELPPGRKEIKTTYTDYNSEEKIFKFVEQEIEKGRQAYVVCPLVEQSEKMDLRSAEEVSEDYQKRFKNLIVELIHGKMKEKEKSQIMERFKQGDIDILVSTTVIEVGINVPNASIMVIENAERFGLAQMHQLRGRIGRGEYESYCILKLAGRGKTAIERAQIMKETSNGFIISEKDLEIRGTGDFFGVKQHGIPDFKIANIFEDMDILAKAQLETMKILEEDPLLEKAENKVLKKKIEKMINTVL